MSTITAKCLISSQTAVDSATVHYTVSSGHTIIDKFTATNTDSSTRTLTVYLVQSGGSAGTSTTILKAKSLSANTTYDLTDLQNQILNSGDKIIVLADAANVVVIRASGREVV